MEKEKKLSTEKTGAGEASFRVYYGATGAAVPFKWESQPGTPKHGLFSDYSAAPPLTPPPSYLARACRQPSYNNNNNNSRNNYFNSFSYRKLKMVVLLTSLPRLVRRGSHVSSSSCSSSFSSSMSSEASSLYYTSSKGWKTTSSRGPQPLAFALMDDNFGEERPSSSMRMCFGGVFGHSVKNALFSVVGRRRRRSSRAVDFFV